MKHHERIPLRDVLVGVTQARMGEKNNRLRRDYSMDGGGCQSQPLFYSQQGFHWSLVVMRYTKGRMPYGPPTSW